MYEELEMTFKADLEIIDGNPFVFLHKEVLKELFDQASKDKGPIRVQGEINGKPYQQTLVRFRGEYRLYINMKMLKDSPRKIGEVIDVEIEFDPSDRPVQSHPLWTKALKENKEARIVFEKLSLSRQQEMIRYLCNLKREESVERNVVRAVNFLLGNGRFVGRDGP